MLWIAYILMASLAAGENLIANPGFEELNGDVPARWNCFVAPQDGAFGRLDNAAHDGKYCVMLHTPLPYETDPANNWSQNILGEFAKKKMKLEAAIKTKDATEVALWLQCWRKQPWGVLLAVSSSQESPMYGTRDWESISLPVEVPDGTDFLTVRCVLKGTGTAWFDDIRLEPQEEMKRPEASPKEKAPSAPSAAETSKPRPAPEPDSVKPLEEELSRLRAANKSLKDTLERIQGSNKQLLQELSGLQEQLKAVQQQMGVSVTGGAGKDAGTTAKPLQAPPLVPHGMDWRSQSECK